VLCSDHWTTPFIVGDVSQVPFDKLTDCDVQEPAGTACCCCVPNVLTTVTVDTASGREMSIQGVKDPFAFKQDVWAMKRGDGLAGVPESIVATSMTRVEKDSKAPVDRGSSSWFGAFGGGGAGDGSEAVPLLREQNVKLDKQAELLSQAVAYLKVIANHQQSTTT